MAAHDYLSTACYHARRGGTDGASVEDLHAYCSGNTGMAGAKKPASCKFCGARCTCPCHGEEPADG
jgi:hypothetical protein